MEVLDSPLNRAHHYSREADQLVGKEKYEEAIVCHGEAAELLKEAVSMRQREQDRTCICKYVSKNVSDSMLAHCCATGGQRYASAQTFGLGSTVFRAPKRHLHQQRLIKMSCEQAELKGKLPVSPHKRTSGLITQCSSQTVLQSPPLGWKAAKDDKTRLEEQSTAIADLWKLTAVLLMENKRLLEEHDKLKAENVGLKGGSYEEHHSPSASPTQPLSVGTRLLHVTPDLQQEIQMLLETVNDG